MNQVLTRQTFKRTRRLATDNRGQGLVIVEAASRGAIIMEYTGELLTDKEADARLSSLPSGTPT